MPRESEPELSLIWSEEFDGSAGSPVDPDIWQPEVGGHGWGNEELQYYTEGTENASLDGAGNLAIVVRRSDSQYTSARLVSKDRVAFTYGLVRVSNLDIQPGDSLRETQRTSLNLTWAPVPQLELVLEFLGGRRVNKDGAKGASSQIQGGWTFRF